MHADTLGADERDRVTAAVDLGALADMDVEAARDIVPERDHRAVESGGIGRAPDQHAGLERRALDDLGRPVSVCAAPGSGLMAIAGGAAFEEIFLLDIAMDFQIEGG